MLKKISKIRVQNVNFVGKSITQDEFFIKTIRLVQQIQARHHPELEWLEILRFHKA